MKKKKVRRNREKERKPEKRRKGKGLMIILSILVLFSLLLVFIQYRYTITTVELEGNLHYTNEEIQDMVIKGKFDQNSIVLSLKYRDKAITDIPFIERMDVTVVSNDTVKIKVYEKALAGYIQYLDRYLYFDKDGIIVESSNSIIENVPLVAGLEFGYVALHEKLPVENDKIFGQILEITLLLIKHEISVDKIYFDSNYNMTLHMTLTKGEIRVSLGTEDLLEQKIVTLKEILPKMEELPNIEEGAILSLENYTEEKKGYTFE